MGLDTVGLKVIDTRRKREYRASTGDYRVLK